MLQGRDLWFLVRIVVTGFTVLFLPFLGLVVRQKWRCSAARKEEIKRLLVLAYEESARAELEANHEYGYGRFSLSLEEPEYEPLHEATEEIFVPAEVEVHLTEVSNVHRRKHNDCVVCSFSTATRCAQCKKVYYCSGKCQIIHWRRGHKDECRPFGDRNNDAGDCPVPNPLIPPSNGVGNRHHVKAVEVNTSDYASSVSNTVKSPDGNDDSEMMQLKNDGGRYLQYVAPTNSDKRPGVASICKSSFNVSALNVNNSNLSGRNKFVHEDTNGYGTNYSRSEHNRPASSEDSHLMGSGDKTSTFKHSHVKHSPVHVNSQHESSSPSGSSVGECDESSFSEPSTPSSGFWEGINNFPGARSDVVDDTSHSCVNEAVDIDASDSHLSPSYNESTGIGFPHFNSPVSNVRKSNDVSLAKSGVKEPINGLASSVEFNKSVTKSERFSMIEERSGNSNVVDANNTEIVFHMKSNQFSSNKDTKANILPDKSKCEGAPECNTFTESVSVDVKSLLSKASGVHLSSGNAMQTSENVKSAKAESIPMTAARKSDFLGQQNDKISSKASVWKVVDPYKASKLAQLNPLGIPSESVGRYCDKGLFQYELFVKLYNWKMVELLPCGLINCGNSCYVNAVLQCLAFTPPLTAYFLQGLHSQSCKKRDWCFTCEFELLVLKAKDGQCPISPSRIMSHIRHIGSHLGIGKEEDAHEFLRYAIDAMQSICLKEVGVSASISLEETTLMGLTFGGYLRSKLECMKCGLKSERHEKMMDLTVEIEGDIGTLEEALRNFTQSETLDGENKYKCGRCKSFEKARKKLRVLEAPNVLTIALKRFQSGKFGKLNKTIKFPEILNMAPYMSGTSDKSPVYRLFGVVVHLDIMNAAFSGHYICYVKNSHNKWFKINDNTVKEIELDRVLTKGAYMLFYARCSPRAPRFLRSQVNTLDSSKADNTDCSRSRYPSSHTWDQSLSNLSSSTESSSLSRASSLEDDSYDNDSSSFFSEVNSSNSTDSNTTKDEYYDQMFGDMGVYWNGSFRNSSDSETLSSTSSPSPMYLRHQSYAGDLDHFSSRHDMNLPCIGADAEGKKCVPFLCPDSTKHRRKISACNNSSSCRESGSRKSGWANSLDNLKSSVTFCRSSRERPD